MPAQPQPGDAEGEHVEHDDQRQPAEEVRVAGGQRPHREEHRAAQRAQQRDQQAEQQRAGGAADQQQPDVEPQPARTSGSASRATAG